MKQTKVWLILTIVLSLLGLASACSKTPEGTSDNSAPTATGKAFTPKGNEGTITGTIAYNGAAPAAKKIDTSADPVCGQKSPNLATEDNVVTNGKLAYAFVYIKDGATTDGTKVGDYTFTAPSDAVTLDQSGCHYKPHVLGAMVNQKLNITNSDPTQHNIHFTPKNNPDWNQSQPNGAPPMSHSFARAEVLVPVKCNQHPWMKAYVGVLKHPFFAVSAEDGTFTIKGVPPGTYTVAAWHEGGATGTEKTMSVTVPASGSAKADFAFGEGATASSKPGLEMMPAIVVPVPGHH
ncbi:MAG TPA: carboxypeptidase regulatory-like domain-containing protein [Pyrinomonadaceae bacterium]|nr:carboxypeptidase regulatory-like domain-containing protein [Pyrinomonadaceae bacterium]